MSSNEDTPPPSLFPCSLLVSTLATRNSVYKCVLDVYKIVYILDDAIPQTIVCPSGLIGRFAK